MIIRVVKMTFREEELDNFLSLFEERKSTIRSFTGCQHLELWQDTKHPATCFTYSIWASEDDLNHYRFSEFFKETWTATKVLFSEKAEAWSLIQKSVP